MNEVHTLNRFRRNINEVFEENELMLHIIREEKDMKRKVLLMLTTAMLCGVIFTGCSKKAEVEPETAELTEVADTDAEVPEDTLDADAAEETARELAEITVLYTNDVHTYIANVNKDDDGNETRGISYASIAALKKELEAEGKNVILVDAGDEIQGSIYGNDDEGKTIIDIMNKTGYELATPGNHEFDYGMFSFFEKVDRADFPYVSCSFYKVEDGSTVFDAYKIIEKDGVKIAFIGVSTPESIIKSTPIYFQDEKGNFIYGFASGENGNDLYDAVQKAIDEVRDEADYVVALGHLGVDSSSVPYRSTDVIANVSGLDAWIDGHSHTTMPMEMIKDKDGKEVVLTQTGCYFSAIGKMTITEDGNISTELIDTYENRDEEVEKVENEWINKVNESLAEKVATIDFELLTTNPDNDKQRLIRSTEMNIGDFNTDAYYYYINDEKKVDCDIVILNGGGIRANVEAGDITYLTAKAVNPYGNVLCVIEASGEQILNALESGVKVSGEWDEEWDCPAENGGFLHVAGLKYEVDTKIPSTIQVDENGIFVGAPTGDYRVKNVKVYNRENGEYEDLELDKTYRVGGINYLLRNGGSGLSMFVGNDVIVDYLDEDYIAFANYCKAFAKEGDVPTISSKNSPLASLKGYEIDYENPYGAGRIVID